MSINIILKRMKDTYEAAIREEGEKSQTSLIRSQCLINMLHDAVKEEFTLRGVNSSKVFPNIGKGSPEIRLSGKLKNKYQDICIIPNPTISTKEQQEKILAINVRSQLSSLSKNFDTLYERTFAEALNLHLANKRQCLGEVYLIPVREYDSDAIKSRTIEYKQVGNIQEYIEKFQLINSRISDVNDEYKYERICLLIVDFCLDQPKIYSDINELKQDKIVFDDSNVSMHGLTWDNFAEDLLEIYERRFRSCEGLKR